MTSGVSGLCEPIPCPRCGDKAFGKRYMPFEYMKEGIPSYVPGEKFICNQCHQIEFRKEKLKAISEGREFDSTKVWMDSF